MAKIFMYKGKSVEELQKMSLEEFTKIVPSRQRRSLTRGFTDSQKKLLKDIRAGKGFVKTQVRDMLVLPEMIGKKIAIYNGKEFISIDLVPEMIAHYLGELVMTRRETKHSAPGVGATRGSKFVPLK